MHIYVLLNRSQKENTHTHTHTHTHTELLITFKMETTLDFNIHICNMDGLKSKCSQSIIAFVVFLLDI